MPFSYFHGDPEICLSVNTIKLIIKCRKIVMLHLYLISQKLNVRHLEMRPRQFPDMCVSCKNYDLLRHWLELKSSCLLNILKTTS